jgi:hypothetical protein
LLPLALFFAAGLHVTAAADQTSPTSGSKAPKELKCLAARAEPWPQGFVKMTIPGEDDRFIAAQRIKRITSADGSDWTSRVLNDRESVEDAALEVCYAEQNTGLLNLRGRPRPEREWFPVIQASFLVPLVQNEVGGEESVGVIAIDLGTMKNVGQMTAFGASVYLGADADRTRFGTKLRLRRWLSRSAAVDVAPGLVMLGTSNAGSPTYSYPGLVGELSVSFEDGVALTGQVETRRVQQSTNVARNSSGYWEELPLTPEDTEVSWYLGAKFGGEFSLPGLLVSAIVVGALSEGSETNP